jgi:hypothetical protein
MLILLSHAPLAAQWSELRAIDGDRASPELAYLDGRLYLFGGFSFYNRDGALTSARVLDLATGIWKPIASMPEPRANGYAAAVDGKIYLIGGTQGPELALQVLQYDPASDSYSQRTPMPTPAFSFAGAVVGGTIYVIGGIPANGTRASPTSAVYAYDVAADRWSRLADLPYATSNFTATAIGNSIYAMGGSVVKPPLLNQPLAYRGEVANDGSIAWHRIADLPDSLTYTTSGTAGGKVIVAGGFNQDGSPTHGSYSYDPASDRWSRSYPLPIDGASAAVSMPGDGTTIYYIGGVLQPRVFAFTGGAPKPILSLDQHDFFATARTGSTTTMLLRVINDGVSPLEGTIDIPGAISWLSPSHMALPSIPILSGSTIALTAGDPTLPAGDYVTTVTLMSNDPARPETALRLHLFVRDSLPLQSLPLVVEEGTGNWNGWEPAARATLDSLAMRHPDRTMILAYHGPVTMQEPMASNYNDETLKDLGLRSYPSASIRRVAAPGEELPMIADRSGWIAEAERQLALAPDAPVRIDVENLAYTPGRNIVADVHVTTTNGLLLDSTIGYRVTAILTEDSVSFPQTRYVIGSDGAITTEQIASYLHNDVVRTVWPDQSGRELVPPDEAVHDNWIGPGVRLDQEIAISTRAAVIPRRGSLLLLVHAMRHGKLAEILNAWRRPIVAIPLGVEESDVAMNGGMTMEAAPNPATGSLRVTYTLPRRGHVAIELFSVIGERLHVIDAGTMEAGDHTAELELAPLPAGAYLLRISTGDRAVSRVVVRE